MTGTVQEIRVGTRNQITIPRALRKSLCSSGDSEMLYIKRGQERNTVYLTADTNEHELRTEQIICTVCPSKNGVVTLPNEALKALRFRRGFRGTDFFRAIGHFSESDDADMHGYIEIVNPGANKRDNDYNTFCTGDETAIISMFDPVSKKPIYYDDIDKAVKLYCSSHPDMDGAFYISYDSYQPGDIVPDTDRIIFPLEQEFWAFDDEGNSISCDPTDTRYAYYKDVLKISKDGRFINGWLGSPKNKYRRPLSEFSIKEEPECWWHDGSRKQFYLDLGDAHGCCVYHYFDVVPNYHIGLRLKELGIDGSYFGRQDYPACPRSVHLYLVAGLYDEVCEEATWRLHTCITKCEDPGEFVLRDVHIIKEIGLKCHALS